MDLTDEEINIKIAEFCGWELRKWEEPGFGWKTEWFHPKRSGDSPKPPSYTTDLNAMHEAEEELTTSLQGVYWKNICSQNLGKPVYHITAKQRALAFIKTITQ